MTLSLRSQGVTTFKSDNET